MGKINSLFLLTVLLASPFLKGLTDGQVREIGRFAASDATTWDIAKAKGYLNDVDQALAPGPKTAKGPAVGTLKMHRKALEAGLSMRTENTRKTVLKEIKTAEATAPQNTTTLEKVAAIVAQPTLTPADLQKATDAINQLAPSAGINEVKKDLVKFTQEIPWYSSDASTGAPVAPGSLSQQKEYVAPSTPTKAEVPAPMPPSPESATAAFSQEPREAGEASPSWAIAESPEVTSSEHSKTLGGAEAQKAWAADTERRQKEAALKKAQENASEHGQTLGGEEAAAAWAKAKQQSDPNAHNLGGSASTSFANIPSSLKAETQIDARAAKIEAKAHAAAAELQ